MMPSTRKSILIFMVAATVGLPLAYFFRRPFVFWLLIGLAVLNVTIWLSLALAHLADTIRFGPPVSLEDILNKNDTDRMVRLIRYHLGWSPEKIVDELNQRGIRNHGLPWHEDDVRRIIKGVRRLF